MEPYVKDGAAVLSSMHPYRYSKDAARILKESYEKANEAIKDIEKNNEFVRLYKELSKFSKLADIKDYTQSNVEDVLNIYRSLEQEEENKRIAEIYFD
jgi:hypothetical protein